MLCVPLCAQEEERNFTGTWKLDPAASQIRALPVPPDAVLHIRHTGVSVDCESQETGIESGCSYKTDGSEIRVDAKGVRISSRTKWEGRALLISSIVSGVKNYTRMDRWTLSSDRNTLRVRRQIVNLRGETESFLVYERQPAAARPAGSSSAGTSP